MGLSCKYKRYTYGIVAELIQPAWALRLSVLLFQKLQTIQRWNMNLAKPHSETAEFEHQVNINKRKGTIRLLFSYTASRAPSYNEGLNALKTNDTFLLHVISGNAQNNKFGGNKTGVGINIDQEIANDISVFARVGWNDGKYVTWAFTEIDETAHAGFFI